jgi:hypothetical protein
VRPSLCAPLVTTGETRGPIAAAPRCLDETGLVDGPETDAGEDEGDRFTHADAEPVQPVPEGDRAERERHDEEKVEQGVRPPAEQPEDAEAALAQDPEEAPGTAGGVERQRHVARHMRADHDEARPEHVLGGLVDGERDDAFAQVYSLARRDLR